jgi:non-canonical purine NTP pyrophosphatase (RdgB/HAM1 family)
MLKFITSNKGKVREVQGILGMPELEQLDIDLPEIQSLDSHEIIKAKLEQATAHHDGQFIVEDVSLSFPSLHGLPGPLIKWFGERLSLEEIYDLVHKYPDHTAEHKIVYGLSTPGQPLRFFEGVTEGEIVKPAGDKDFGWGPMFKPRGSDKTYGEMNLEEKLIFSPRAKALKELRKLLEV